MYATQNHVDILNKLTATTKFNNDEERQIIGSMMQAVLKRCSWDMRFFFANYVKIVSYKTDEFAPFIVNEGQKKLLLEYYRAQKAGGKIWLVISKARQAGFTTLTNAMMFHQSLFHKNSYVAIIAQKEDTSKKNLSAIRTMLQTLPWWFTQRCIEWDCANTGRHVNSASQVTFKSIITDTEVKLQAFSASAKAVRGETPTAVHWTETAFCEEAYEMAKAIFPALRRRSRSLVILESTSNGTGNFYSDTVSKVKEGSDSQFRLVFHPWHEDALYRAPIPATFQLTDDEKKLKAEFDLDDEQLVFRRITIADNGGDVNSFMQEYPSTVEESFIATDSLYFTGDTRLIVEDLVSTTPYLKRIHYTDAGIVPSEFGNTFIWANPELSYQYAIGMDCSEGTEGGDYTVISVIDPFGKLVACFRDKARPDVIAAIAAHLGRQYNNARILVERNGIGSYILLELSSKLRYGNIYNDTDGRPGFKTQEHSKKRILAQLQQDIVDRTVCLPHPELLTEFSTFEVTESGKAQAKKGFYDDTVMGMALAVESFKTFRPSVIDPEYSEQPLKVRRFA